MRWRRGGEKRIPLSAERPARSESTERRSRIWRGMRSRLLRCSTVRMIVPSLFSLGWTGSKALDRMGVKTVEELLSFADVSGDPKLSVNEVREHREKIKNMERNEVKTLEGADLEGLKQQIAESMLQGLILHFSSPPSQLTPFA
mmetsp:Transcript_39225/g.123732  ORF Transcript_39225/g.123732 Transcript_39225/m.123732 type:complete len:144 (-) Transcript_39225:238-669(-)